MRIQSTHDLSARGLDPYFTCPEAVYSLLHIEAGKIPHRLWEPAAGDGAISKILLHAGHDVVSTDIADYGWAGCASGIDYLTATRPDGIGGIVTNPPFALAARFALKAFGEVSYLALLLRTNFLESCERRKSIFGPFPPTRIWISSRRLPMMHRQNWAGKRAPSNTCHAWFIWKAGAAQEPVQWFDWIDFVPSKQLHPFAEAAE